MILRDGGVHVRIVVPRETAAGERRVALVPESCKKLIAAGYEIAIESGAGVAAGLSDQIYSDTGASLVTDPAALLPYGGLVLKLTAPTPADTVPVNPGPVTVGPRM